MTDRDVIRRLCAIMVDRCKECGGVLVDVTGERSCECQKEAKEDGFRAVLET